MKSQVKNIVIVALFLLLLGGMAYFAISWFNMKNELKKRDNIVEANELLKQELKVVKNKLGERSSLVKTLRTSNSKLIFSLEKNDADVKRLEKLVEKYKEEIDKGGNVIVITDTVYITNTLVSGNDGSWWYNDEWINLIVDPDSTSMEFDLTIANRYSVIVGEDKTGFLKLKRTPFTLVTNENPYAIVTSVKSYEVELPRKKWFFGFNAGYGLALVDGQVRPAPVISFGINRNL